MHAADDSTRHFPYDIIEMITAHLADDLRTLKACSLTCRSWYSATVPHLHYVLTLNSTKPDKTLRKLKPLSKLCRLGLNPRIKEVRVSDKLGPFPWFVPHALSPCNVRRFSTFANVQTLVLESVHIRHFIPNVKLYFGHLSQTLRSIEVQFPKCAPRQLSHFLSLFSNLDDIKLLYAPIGLFDTDIPDVKLVPFSAPKLQGRLELYDFHWVETCTDLVTSCGLRFHYMDLRKVGGCAPVLLEACAETLETLRFGVTERSNSKYLCGSICGFQLMSNRIWYLLVTP